jgi:probable H4MPT-linked C1 transfer pathway protein
VSGPLPRTGTTAEDVLAFDVGGANLKAADGLGWAHSERLELWRQRAELPAALARIVAERRPDRIVATMTGEIADCYASRREGVADIVAAVVAAAAGCPVGIYLVDGTIVSPADALTRPRAAAASNWHAVARLAGHAAPTGRSLLVDVGSTTTDIVPLDRGRPVQRGNDDVGRMTAGELVYTGVERTPVAALVRRLPWRGRLRPVATETFATSRDVWLLLGGLPEEPRCHATADGGPATRAAAAGRLARMILADASDVCAAEAVAMAERCSAAQCRLVARAIAQVAAAAGGPPARIVLSGHGHCLARRALAALGWTVDTVSLPETLGPTVSRAAPAHAVARIARGLLA